MKHRPVISRAWALAIYLLTSREREQGIGRGFAEYRPPVASGGEHKYLEVCCVKKC